MERQSNLKYYYNLLTRIILCGLLISCSSDVSIDVTSEVKMEKEPTPKEVIIPVNNKPTTVSDNVITQLNTNVTFNPLINDTDSDGDSLIITSVDTTTGGTTSFTDSSITFSPTVNFEGETKFNYDVTDSQGDISQGEIIIVVLSEFTWTGNGGDSNWSNGSNWCGSIVANTCQGDGAPPSGSDIAYFNYTCSNCDVTIDSNISLDSIKVQSSYTGTISQGTGRTIDLAETFSMEGGNFIGSNADIRSRNLSLSGGVFTAPQAEIRIRNDLTIENIENGTTFNHNNGTIEFYDNSELANVSIDTAILNHLIVDKYGGSNILIDGIMNVSGDVTIDIYGSSAKVNGGSIYVGGNLNVLDNNGGTTNFILNGNSNQNISFNSNQGIGGMEIASTGGVVTFTSNAYIELDFIYTSGSVDFTGNSLVMIGTADATLTTGSLSLAGLSINKYASNLDITGVCIVEETLSLDSYATGGVKTGEIHAKGDFIVEDHGKESNAKIVINGSTNQSINFTGSSMVGADFEIASTGGTVSFISDSRFSANFTYTSGVVDFSTHELQFIENNDVIIDSNGLIFGNVFVDKITSAAFDLTGSLDVNGNLRLDSYGSSNGLALNGTIYVAGDLTYQSSVSNVTAQSLIVMDGNTNQSITYSSSYSASNLEIASTGGVITFLTNADFDGNLTLTSGVIDANGFNIDASSGLITLEAAATLNINGGSTNPAYGSGSFIDNGGVYNP